MFTVPMCMRVLAAIEVASAVIFYEDDPQNFKYQHAADITRIPQILLVKRQTAGNVLHPNTRCQAMRIIRRTGPNHFLYQIFYGTIGRPNHVTSFTTTLTTSLTALHREANVLAFQTVRGGPEVPYKLMYSDPRNGCFVLVFNRRPFVRGCRLLQTPLTVNHAVPITCLRVYFENCPADSVEIYDRFCRQHIIPHLG